MLFLDKLNAEPRQFQRLIGQNGVNVPFYLEYYPSQQAWFAQLQYNEFVLRGIQIGVGPNIMRGYRNILPFGLACTSIDGLEPMYLTDFAGGRIKLFLLNATEVEEIEQGFFT